MAEEVVGRVVYAGFWRRCFSAVIDSLILLIPISVVNIFAWKDVGLPVVVGFAQLVWLSYYAFFESSKWQATPGRRLMSVCLVSEKGEPVSLALCALRYVIWILPCVPYILFLMSPQYIKIVEAVVYMKLPSPEARRFLNQSHLDAVLQMRTTGLIGAGGMLLLTCLPMAFTKQKTALHDMLVKTRMLKGKAPAEKGAERGAHAVTSS